MWRSFASHTTWIKRKTKRGTKLKKKTRQIEGEKNKRRGKSESKEREREERQKKEEGDPLSWFQNTCEIHIPQWLLYF